MARQPTAAPDAAEESDEQPRTDLWRRLMESRSQLIAAGVPLLDWHDIDRALHTERGEGADGEE